MKKLLIIIALSFVTLTSEIVRADFWERPDSRPTQPSFERNLPTTAPLPSQEPTAPPSGPTATPRVGGSLTETPAPTNGGDGGTGEDACASGKSFTGPYCGWSPRIGGEAKGAAPGGGEKAKVLGLSATSSRDLMPSDIIFLTGVLCLLLYVRSKLAKVKSV